METGDEVAVMAKVTDPVDGDHARGPASAPVLMIYGDFECPYTRAAYRAVQVLEHRRVALRLVFRHFPLTEVHPHALHASFAAEAAARQDRYWDMHELLFKNRTELEDDELVSYAGQLGLDTGAFQASFGSEVDVARIERDVRSGLAAGVQGIPAVFVDGTRIAGYRVEDLLPLLS